MNRIMRRHTLILEYTALSVFIIVAQSSRSGMTSLPVRITGRPGLDDAAAIPALIPLSLAIAHHTALLN